MFAVILCLTVGGVITSCILFEGILAVLERVQAAWSSDSAAKTETNESPLGSAHRRPVVDRSYTPLTRPVNSSAERRTATHLGS